MRCSWPRSGAMARSDDPFFLGSRVRSRPIRLHWAGWETTTDRLQNAGWEVSAQQDFARMRMQLALRHEQLGVQAITQGYSEWDFREGSLRSGPSHLAHPDDRVMHLHMAREIRMHGQTTDWAAVDCSPTIQHDTRIERLEDFAHFAPMKSLAAPFVLPEADVDQLLAIILEKQQKAKTDYFRDMVRKEGAILPAHTMSAQIIALREAA